MRLRECVDPMALLDAALALGCTAFDTAHAYGSNEVILGKWLQRQPTILRQRLFLIGKGCHPNRQGHSRVNRECAESDLNESLTRLHTPYLDIYLLHRDDCAMSIPSIVTTMDSLVHSNKIRAWGTSNWQTERVNEALAYAERMGLSPPVANSCQYSLARPDTSQLWTGATAFTREQVLHNQSSRVVLLGWSSLASGYLSSRTATQPPAFHTRDNEARRERAWELGVRLGGLSLTQVALAYALHGGATFAVASVGSADHLSELVAATNIKLTDEAMDYLERDNNGDETEDGSEEVKETAAVRWIGGGEHARKKEVRRTQHHRR
jgi:aryl-alcohol dehydrogenase-like predicted oxidoreductase